MRSRRQSRKGDWHRFCRNRRPADWQLVDHINLIGPPRRQPHRVQPPTADERDLNRGLQQSFTRLQQPTRASVPRVILSVRSGSPSPRPRCGPSTIRSAASPSRLRMMSVHQPLLDVLDVQTKSYWRAELALGPRVRQYLIQNLPRAKPHRIRRRQPRRLRRRRDLRTRRRPVEPPRVERDAHDSRWW